MSSLTPTRSPAETALLPLTSLQQGMVFHAMGQAATGVDIEHVTFELDEHLDTGRLVEAWQHVSSQNETLHAAIDVSDGAAGLRLAPNVRLPVAEHRWGAFDQQERERRWADLVASDRVRGFDLSAAPLQRLHLVEWEVGRWRGLWSFHHVILDGRSFPLVLRDVFTMYDAGVEPAARPSSQLHTAAVASQDRFGDQAFWGNELKGLEAQRPLRIVSDAEASATRSGSGPEQLVHQTRLDRATTAAIVEGAETLGVSTNTLVQTAWSVLLHRYHGTDDIVFGSTRACRHVTPNAEDMVGLLINTVPFRVHVDRERPVGELLRDVAATHLRLRKAETSPLHLIKGWAGIDADAELFESLVMFDEQTLGRRLIDLGEHRHFEYAGQTNLPVTLLVYADPEMLVRLETMSDTFGEAASRRLLDQFCTVLADIAQNPSQAVGSIGYLTEHDQHLLERYNLTDVDYELDQTLDSLLRAQAVRTPDATALTCGSDHVTFAELRDRVERVAAWLSEGQVGPGSVVGVLAERSIDMLVAVHGVIAAGAAYLPLDPTLPDERIRFMVEDTDARTVLTTSGLDNSAFPDSIRVAMVSDLLEHQRSHRLHPPGATDAAYVIYTSGSTGKPKGVVNEHRGIVNRLLWMQEAFGLTSDDVVVQKTPFTFDVSVWELFWPLMTGARLHIAQPDAHRDPKKLAAEISASRATTVHFVPSMLSVFVDEPSATECTSLRRVICSGEALSRDLQDRTLERLDTELHNLYGPTEAAVDVTWWRCDPSSPLDIVPIGAAIANTGIHILDHRLEPVPPGAVGEIFISGVQVARGYLNRPSLNDERFFDHGIEGVDRRRMYRTGDLGRHREDGTVEYLGRTDHQVKIRGLRIELGEIEATLMSHPVVSNAAVTVREDRPGDQQLIGYVAIEGVAPDDLDADLRRHLARSLAEYMIPAHILCLDEFPLTTSGKIDRKALPAPQLTSAAAAKPQGTTEQTVASIWRELLEVEGDIDRSTPFFRAGGHSLLVVRLANALSERFDTTVEVTSLIDHATIAAQAALLSDDTSARTTEPRRSKINEAAAQRRAAVSNRRRAANRRPRPKR